VAVLLAATVLLAGVHWPARAIAEEPAANEYLVKAAMIYKLAKFVVWPRSGEGAEASEFGVCVLGRDPFGSALAALEGKSIGEAAVRVRYYPRAEAGLFACRILFLAQEQKGQLDELLPKLRGKPILTISDFERFAERGGMVELSPASNRVSIVINQSVVRQAGLQVAAPLLSLATVIDQ